MIRATLKVYDFLLTAFKNWSFTNISDLVLEILFWKGVFQV